MRDRGSYRPSERRKKKDDDAQRGKNETREKTELGHFCRSLGQRRKTSIAEARLALKRVPAAAFGVSFGLVPAPGMRAQRSLEYAEAAAGEVQVESERENDGSAVSMLLSLFSFVLRSTCSKISKPQLSTPSLSLFSLQAPGATAMASPGGGGARRGGNSRQHHQQQQHPSFEAPSPPRVPAAAAAAAAAVAAQRQQREQEEQQQQQQQYLYHEDANNPLATLAAQLPILAADPYYGALIGTLPAHVRARLEREGGHRPGAATAGADVVAAATDHYNHQLSLGAAAQEAGVGAGGRGEEEVAAGTSTAMTTAAPQRQQQQQHQQRGVVYINPKQYHRILVRRAARAREAAKGAGAPKSRGAFIHASRHEAALRRPRVRGKFLPGDANANGGAGGASGGGGRRG